MATKQQVIQKAKQLGCTVECDSTSIEVIAPTGYLIDGEMHYSCFEFDSGYTKGEIYSNLLDELSVGLTECEGTKYCNCKKEG